ncbi:heterodisulfide reductase-related iron-sulfur binding cluster [Desulfonatronum thioautotrophicum]|uniref:heterodisulfide reductase-related iron-sulfur binding cluster n=1 Tax=Desulfonatronum thioautotrophicum TaxID=617001 RepID=UPI0005EAF986|nr:heterodisulfide reductase-related iron-sulfur binding cluster [Desulfonatronum thioautotrophicum]
MSQDAPNSTPEKLIQNVVTACGSCEDCRHFIEDACLFLPELFRLHDSKREHGEGALPAELKRLSDLCNLCGLCPCVNIRREIMDAKVAYAKRDGLPFSVRTLQDVGRIGKLCGSFPSLSGLLTSNPATSTLIKRTLGIHPDRAMPDVPRKNFDHWVRNRPSVQGRNAQDGVRKAVYFPGCTARFLFPDVARAAVEVLEASGVLVVSSVIEPDGACCGMPPLLEGDQGMALGLVERNLRWMAEHVAAGFDLVCSCPTCGYFFKHLLREGAYYSDTYQDQVGGDARSLRIPAGMGISGPREGDMIVLRRATYGPILRDTGPFSSLDPLQRIAVGEHAYDLGEYLGKFAGEGRLPAMNHPVPERAVYYPPCHLREQKIGYPFLDLLSTVPELDVTPLTGTLNCCGMAGIMGYKKEFHQPSLKLGAPLMDKIRAHRPEVILTECLSCRLQFEHMDAIPVRHPVQVLRDALFKPASGSPSR